VHAKVALVKRKKDGRTRYTGLFSTGNLNENTARFYTDHILLSSDAALTSELEWLFLFLAQRRKPQSPGEIRFRHLLVAGFNLQDRFFELIDREIAAAAEGKEAHIQLKLNNLEEELLIDKLYEASQAGVKIDLLIRGICRLIPGTPDLSETITVKRIVDRYLEHGRIFYFYNQGDPEVFLGSADWMNRNIYRRIEVCFPVREPSLREALIELLAIQQQDTLQSNAAGERIRSQVLIREYLASKT
jgi:polyphosphate kinase